MQLSAPKQITFWIAVVLAILGILGYFVPSLGLAGFSFWLLFIGFVILAAANLFEGL
jgi:cytochrome c oxidase subunit IV